MQYSGYDGSSRIATMTDPASGVYQYAYDADGNLSSVAYPDSKVRTYHYNEAAFTSNTNLPYALTGITDENGVRFATYTYDTQGRAFITEHAGGAGRHTLSYSTGSTTTTDPLGSDYTRQFQTILGVAKSISQTQPAGAGCSAAASATTYDVNGNVSSSTDFNGNKTCFAFDLTRNLETARVEGLASGTACPSDPVNYIPANATERKTLTTWDANFRLPTLVTEAQHETSLSYDTHGKTTNLSIRDTATNATRTWTTTYSYHPTVLGALTQRIEDGPRTDVSDITTIDYYAPDASCASGHFGCRGQVSRVTNALGHITQITRYNALGQPEAMIDPNGLVTALTYDGRQRLLSRTESTETTQYQYDGVGQVTRITFPDNSFLNYTYDGAHRLIEITDTLSNRIHYTLDLMGNRTTEDVLDPSNTLLRTHNRVYDALNRMQQEYGVTTQLNYEYDPQGNLTAVIDALNQTTRYTYDALNRQLTLTDPANGVTRFGYNALDQLTQVTDPNNIATQYSYDALNDLTQQTSLDSGTTQNTYDEAGNLSNRTDAKGQTASYTYDALNRLTRALYPATASSGALQIDYQYDVGTNAIGHLTRITETDTGVVAAINQNTYNTYGKLDSMTRTLGVASHTTRYRYDTAGRLTGLTYPSDRTVDYTLDSVGRIQQIATTKNGITQPVVTNISYPGFDNLPSTYTLGNGRIVDRTTDLEGKITSYTLSGYAQTLGYDPVGHIVTRTNSANPLLDTSSYGYNALGRLISDAMPSTAQSYQYDANGNRTSRTFGTTTESYAYNPATGGNRLNSTTLGGNVHNFNHDANGSIIADNTIQYGYDARNRKTQATVNGITTQYRYDAFGQRSQKADAQTQTIYHYDLSGKLISESDVLGTPQREYIYLGDKPVAVWE